MKKRSALAVCLLICVVLLMGGCGTNESGLTGNKGSNREITDEGLKKVTVILDYVPNTNHTGMYVAEKLGYYEEMGLEVEIVEPTEGVTNSLIAAGKGDFGISFQEDVVYALTAEEPLPIKAIAAIIQHNTSGFGTYARKGIKAPADFEGKVYAGWGSPAEEAIIQAVMEEDGADFNKLDIIMADSVDYSMLQENIDIMWMYWAWDGIAARRNGVDINYMELRQLDDRLDYYTPVIVANTKVLEEEPELVKAFLAATAKGYEYAIENPVEAATVLYEAVGTYDLEMLVESQTYLAGKYIEDASQWGIMNDTVWDRYTEFMVEKGLIAEGISADKCYTNQFLPTVN